MIKSGLVVLTLTAAIALLAVGHPANAVAQGGNCFASFNSEISDLTRLKPLNPNWGTRDSYQWSYFIGEEGIKILMKYQSCLSSSDFASNFQALDGMRDKGLEGCKQTSSDPSSCRPSYPGQ